MRRGNTVGLDAAAVHQLDGLLLQLVDAGSAQTGDRLERRRDHPQHARRLVQWLERDRQGDRRHVGAGNQAARDMVGDVSGIHFRHDHRHIRIAGEELAGIDDHGAGIGAACHPLGAHLLAGGKKDDVRAREVGAVERLHACASAAPQLTSSPAERSDA